MTAGRGGGTLADRTVQLARALQAAGVNVSLSEIIDATRSTTEIDLSRRPELHAALRSTMVKQARHYPTFEWAFDRYFPARLVRGDSDLEGGHPQPEDLVEALAGGADLAAMAAALVDEHAGLADGARSERHHVQRVFLGADIARLMSRVRIADPDLSPALIRARVDELKRLIGADVRAQLDLSELPGIEADLHDVDFLEASRAELDQMRDAIRPIARKLAARLARRRQHRLGRVNMRRTMRRSLGSGGVPIDVIHDRPRAHKPELFVLCDISGSVADFSLFTLTLDVGAVGRAGSNPLVRVRRRRRRGHRAAGEHPTRHRAVAVAAQHQRDRQRRPQRLRARCWNGSGATRATATCTARRR